MSKKQVYLRIDSLECPARHCPQHTKGYSFLPIKDDIIPEVYCGNCGSRVEAEFLTQSNN